MLTNITVNDLRRVVLEMAFNGNSVHIACAFSIIEIVYIIYFKLINIEKLVSLNLNRDYVCLSKGHGVMSIYACLHKLGMIPKSSIDNYFSDDSILTGLADSHVPGIEVSGGSLGHGITVATGLALSKKIDNSEAKVFCIIGDGELNEGSTWESIMIAAQHKLRNLILVIDANNYQAMGTCKNILNMEPLVNKFESFACDVKECDGHDTGSLEKTFRELLNSKSEKPKVLVARTVKGKGISFMENNNEWHYSRLDKEKYLKALEEIKI